MAINPSNRYPNNVDPASTEYPYGKARDVTVPGDGTGTPWESALVNDLFGFQQALLDDSGDVPTGTPERVGASQYLNSIVAALNSRSDLSFATVQNLKDETARNGKGAKLKAGTYVKTTGYGSDGDGGGATYALVTPASFGGTPDGVADHLLTSGDLVAVLQPDSLGFVESRQIGVVFNDAGQSGANLVAINTVARDKLRIDTRGETVHFDANALNDNTAIFKWVAVWGDGTLNIATGGTLFTIDNGGTAVADKVTVTATSTRSELFATTYNTDTLVELITVIDCTLTGYVRLAIEANMAWNQDPDVARNGVNKLVFERNNVADSDDAAIWLNNAMYRTVVINDNEFKNCRGMYVYDSIVNSSTNYEKIQDAKLSLQVRGNRFVNDIDFFGDSTQVGAVYVGFVLTEGNNCQYANNYCKNIQRRDPGDGAYDIYMGGRFIEVSDNQCINRFDFSSTSASNYATNVALKIKKTENCVIDNHTHIYEDGYFEYHQTNNGLSKSGQLGDFFSMEHSIADGPAYNIILQNSYIEQPVLSDVQRDGFNIRSMLIRDNTFVSDGGGTSTMIAAKVDPAVNVSPDSRVKTFEIIGNKFYLQNTDLLSLCSLVPFGQQPIRVTIGGNSGTVKNLRMFSATSNDEIMAINGVDISYNNFDVTGTIAEIISRFAVMPVMKNMQLEHNVINAPACDGNSSLYGGVTTTAVTSSASCRFTTPVNGDIQIETIIGIYEWERETRQTVSIDLEMGCDNRKAAASEDIADALDYKSVAKRLISFVEESEFLLVETLAERLASIVLEEFSVPWLRLRLGKPGAVTGSKDVGVIIERGSR